MHGLHNFLNGVLLAAVRELLSAKGMAATEVARLCSMGLQRGEDWLFDDDNNSKKSISLSLGYLTRSGFGQLLTVIRALLPAATCMNVEAAMQDLKNMVAIVYTPLPSEAETLRFEALSNDLRLRCKVLKAPTTVWGHVWTVHLPQFLRRWKSLYPFVCHGVEGKHRVFKADLQMSAGNQWRTGFGFGFAHTLSLDRIRWQLFAEGTREWRRPRVCCDAKHLKAYRDYESHMLQLVRPNLL
jgi:hypothetical protein